MASQKTQSSAAAQRAVREVVIDLVHFLLATVPDSPDSRRVELNDMLVKLQQRARVSEADLHLELEESYDGP